MGIKLGLRPYCPTSRDWQGYWIPSTWLGRVYPGKGEGNILSTPTLPLPSKGTGGFCSNYYKGLSYSIDSIPLNTMFPLQHVGSSHSVIMPAVVFVLSWPSWSQMCCHCCDHGGGCVVLLAIAIASSLWLHRCSHDYHCGHVVVVTVMVVLALLLL